MSIFVLIIYGLVTFSKYSTFNVLRLKKVVLYVNYICLIL